MLRLKSSSQASFESAQAPTASRRRTLAWTQYCTNTVSSRVKQQPCNLSPGSVVVRRPAGAASLVARLAAKAMQHIGMIVESILHSDTSSSLVASLLTCLANRGDKSSPVRSWYAV